MNQQAAEFLVHQPSADIVDGSGAMYEGLPLADAETDHSQAAEDSIAYGALCRVVALKRESGTELDKVFDIADGSTEHITDNRRPALEFALDLREAAMSTPNGASWYGLADVKEFTDNTDDLDALCVTTDPASGSTVYVRLEESLAIRANHLIREAHSVGDEPGNRAYVANDELHIKNGDGHKSVPLHGYTFNRNADDPSARIRVDDMPSCESFMAATVQEQVELAGSGAVLRVIPHWMKDREVHARDLLQLTDGPEQPVMSVVVGPSGDVEKIIRWGGNKQAFEPVMPFIQSRRAHHSSRAVSKKIHDTMWAEHSDQYEEFCMPELDSNIPPGKLLDFELVTARAHEFMSRTLRAAPLYEQTRPGEDSSKESLSAILMLNEMMSHTYQHTELEDDSKPVTVQHVDGVNTNNVTYVHAILASRPEADSALPDSTQIDVAVHMVIEGLSDTERRQIGGYETPIQAFRDMLPGKQLRYCLIEAQRTDGGDTLGRARPVDLKERTV